VEAGFGAEEQASRRGRRIERLRREHDASDSTTSAVEAALERAQREQRNWSAGAEGERLVAQTLEILSRYGWTSLHDVHWPGRPLANIDHIAIGPGGVVVIDAKNWTGEVTYREGVLRQNGYRRDGELDGVAAATAAVTALLAPVHRSAVLGAICLASHDQPPVRTVPGVRVVGRMQLTEYLVGMPPRLSPFDVADIGRFLFGALAGSSSPDLTTTAALTRDPRPSRSKGAGAQRKPPRSRLSAAPSVRSGSQRGGRRPSRTRQQSPSCLGPLVRLMVALGVGLLILANLGRIGGLIGSALTSAVVPTHTTTTQVHPSPTGP
jgi:hypothetical protein